MKTTVWVLIFRSGNAWETEVIDVKVYTDEQEAGRDKESFENLNEDYHADCYERNLLAKYND